MSERATRCPHCETSFYVSHQQLQSANGLVRCGACLQVFDAARHWVEQLPSEDDSGQLAFTTFDEALDTEDDLLADLKRDNASVLPTFTEAATISPADFAVEGPAAGSPEFSDEVPEVPQDDKTIDPDAGAEHALASDMPPPWEPVVSRAMAEDPEETDPAPFDGARPETLSPVSAYQDTYPFLEGPADTDAENDLTDGEPDQEAAQPPNWFIPASPDAVDIGTFQADSEEADSASMDEDWPETEDTKSDVQRDEYGDRVDDQDDEKPFAPGAPAESEREFEPDTALENEDYSLHAIRDELVNRKQRSRRNGLWLLLTLIAALGLAGQYAYFNFDTLIQSPYRHWFERGCTLIRQHSELPCELPAPVHLEMIRSVELVVRSHPDQEGALRVDALIRNDAAFDQPYPALQLQFTNLSGQIVAARRFQPPEYLGGEVQAGDAMPRKQDIRIVLELLDPAPDAMNYQLLFYPASES